MTDRSWHVVHSPEFEAWFHALPDDQAVAVAADMVVLATLGPQLGRPHVDTLKGSKHPNMKELRTGTIRTAFAFDPGRQAVLLCAGDKRGANSRRFYAQLVKRADAIYDAHLASLAERQEERPPRPQENQ